MKKIAIATNDRETIAKRTGQAKEFAIVELDDNMNEISRFFVENHHEHEEEEEDHNHSHAELIESLGDIDSIYVRMVGKHLKSDLDNAGIKIVKIDNETINSLLNDLAK